MAARRPMGFPPAAVSVGEGTSKEIFVLNGHCAMEGEHVDGSGKLKLKRVHVFRRPSHQRCLLPLCDGGRTRRSAMNISYVFRRPSTAMLASAVRWREGTIDSWCKMVLLPASSILLLCDGAGAMKPCLFKSEFLQLRLCISVFLS